VSLPWVVSCRVNGEKRFRASNGKLTADVTKARQFSDIDEALEHSKEGDVIERVKTEVAK
jgi:hypothetical protein